MPKEIMGIQYYRFNEIKEQANIVLRNRILEKARKTGYNYMGDISKVGFTKAEQGKVLQELGFLQKRLKVDGKQMIYYYKNENGA